MTLKKITDCFHQFESREAYLENGIANIPELIKQIPKEYGDEAECIGIGEGCLQFRTNTGQEFLLNGPTEALKKGLEHYNITDGVKLKIGE